MLPSGSPRPTRRSSLGELWGGTAIGWFPTLVRNTDNTLCRKVDTWPPVLTCPASSLRGVRWPSVPRSPQSWRSLGWEVIRSDQDDVIVHGGDNSGFHAFQPPLRNTEAAMCS
jgi:hypothetical protein